MKRLFFIIGIASFSFAAAQDNGLPKVKVVPPKPKNNIASAPNKYFVFPGPHLLSNSKLINTLPNGSKIYALPQDNMPCIVPDMSQSNMPVATPQIHGYKIPNPAYPPPSVTPRIMTEDQLKELKEKVIKQR